MSKSVKRDLNRLFVLLFSVSSVTIIQAINPEYYSYYYSLIAFGFFVVLLSSRTDDLVLIGYAALQFIVMFCYMLMLSTLSEIGDALLYPHLTAIMLAYEIFMGCLIGGCFVLHAYQWVRNIVNGIDSIIQGR